MDISLIGINLIKKYEGCRLKAYKPVPTEKYWTIGYGHYGPDIKEGQTINQAQADNYLKIDLKKFVDGVNSALKVQVNQNQFDALVSFSYNCGLGALQKSTLLELVNKKEFDKAALEFEKWNKGGGKVLPGLVKRRNEEKELFTLPIKKEENRVLKLNDSQFTMLYKAYKSAYDKKILSSDEWHKKAENKTLTVDEAIFINAIIATRLLK